MPTSMTPDPLVPGIGKCTNIGLVASWLCPEREGETGRDKEGHPYRYGTRASADGICDMQTVEQISQALGLEMEYVFLSHTRGGPVSHNFAHWCMAKMDRLHEAALIEDWARALESEVDVKVWRVELDDEIFDETEDWKASVATNGTVLWVSVKTDPAEAIKAALARANEDGSLTGCRHRVTVYFADASHASPNAFRLATDDLPQAVKEEVAAKYVRDRDARKAEDDARLAQDPIGW